MLFQQPLSERIPNLHSEGYMVKRPIASNAEFSPLSDDTAALVKEAEAAFDDLPAPEDTGGAVVDLPGTYKPVASVTEDVDALIKKFQEEEGITNPASQGGQAAAEVAEIEEILEDVTDGNGQAVIGADFAEIANMMQEKGLITEIPTTVDPENLTIESFWDVVNHNIEIRAIKEFESGQQTGVNDLAAKMSPATVSIMQFNLDNPNASDEDTFAFVENIMYTDTISKLDASNIYDAETIVRQYLLSTGEFQDSEIDAEIEGYKDINKLESKAQSLKPKLELKLKQQREQKEQASQEIRKREVAVENHFLSRVDTLLRKGEIKGIALGEEEKNTLYAILSNNNVPVPVKGGKQVEMGYLDHLTRKHRYSQEGDLEALMLSILIMEGKDEAIKKHYANPVAKAEVRKFVQAAKNNTFKSAQVPAATNKNKPNPELNNKENFFKSLRGNPSLKR